MAVVVRQSVVLGEGALKPLSNPSIVGTHPKRKRLVVLESPYAGETAAHVAFAKQCLRDSLDRGEAPMASHLLYTQVLDDSDRDERAAGINAGHAWLHRADAVVVYTDLGISEGMRAGIATAELHGVPIEYRLLAPA